MRLEDACRARLVNEFRDASNLEEAERKRKAAKLSVKAACQVVPDVVEEQIGGRDKQLPISIDEYERDRSEPRSKRAASEASRERSEQSTAIFCERSEQSTANFC